MSIRPEVSTSPQSFVVADKVTFTPRLNGLDHVRATAIVLVLLFHYRLFMHPAWVNDFGNFGWTGVDMFFVLSGYLIGGQLLKQAAANGRISLKEFYLKRSFRILPVYFFIVALYFLFPGLREWGTPAPFWKYLTFTQNIGLDLQTQRAFSHAWSLCIEEQFYLLFPLMLMFLLNKNWMKYFGWFMLVVFVFGLIIRYFTWNHFLVPILDSDDFGVAWHKWMYYPVWTRLDGLLTGVGIAALLRFKPGIAGRIQALGNWLLLIAAVLTAVAFYLASDSYHLSGSVFGFPVVSLAYGVLVLAALSPKSILYRWSSRLTRTIAILSYSVYLCHKIVIHLVQELLPHFHISADSNACMAISLAASVLAGWLLHQAIEKPFMRLRDMVLRDNTPRLKQSF